MFFTKLPKLGLYTFLPIAHSHSSSPFRLTGSSPLEALSSALRWNPKRSGTPVNGRRIRRHREVWWELGFLRKWRKWGKNNSPKQVKEEQHRPRVGVYRASVLPKEQTHVFLQTQGVLFISGFQRVGPRVLSFHSLAPKSASSVVESLHKVRSYSPEVTRGIGEQCSARICCNEPFVVLMLYYRNLCDTKTCNQQVSVFWPLFSLYYIIMYFDPVKPS